MSFWGTVACPFTRRSGPTCGLCDENFVAKVSSLIPGRLRGLSPDLKGVMKQKERDCGTDGTSGTVDFQAKAVGLGNAAVGLENEAVRIQNEAVNFRTKAVKRTSAQWPNEWC